MQTIRFLLVAGWLLTGMIGLHAQPGDLNEDRAFFEQQAQLYQRWLEHSGLAPGLRVRQLDIQSDRLSLFLEMPYQDLDTLMVAWDSLKTGFERIHTLSLEQQLFYKLVHLMEVRQDRVDVQLYDTYDLRREPLFMRAIYFAEGKVRVEESNPRSKVRQIILKPLRDTEGRTPALLDFQERCAAEALFEQVLRYAENHYQQTTCTDRVPSLRVLETGEVLRFEVVNLCREVLTEDAQPTLCGILRTFGYPCDWAKRELLIFTVTCQNAPAGVQMGLTIEGKYGSGFYESVRRGAYLDMEIDFDDYLERYADLFTESLKRHLSCP